MLTLMTAAPSPQNDDDNDFDINPPSLSRSQSDDDDECQYHWLSKVITCPYHFEEAPYHIRNNKTITMAAVKKNGWALRLASPRFQNDKQVVMAAIERKKGRALKFASPNLRNDKDVVMAAVQKNGDALQFASPSLQNDKDVALVAVNKDPDNIKYVNGDLKRDPDILIAAGMYDMNYDNIRQQTTTITRKIALSTRFSLNESSQSLATDFTAVFKKSRYIQEGNFIVYAPNAFDKKSCDPEWTRFDWPCRGTVDTCKYNNILLDEGRPTNDCCWRYSFRSQLKEAKDTGGFMLQLVETEPSTCHGKVEDATLGFGQQIELDMANAIGTKVFQVYCPDYDGYEGYFVDRHINFVTAEISRWYNDKNKKQCQDDIMSVTKIRQRWR